MNASCSRSGRSEATGDMIMVRYADDTVVGFQHESDARRFRDAMRDRLREFSLSIKALIPYARNAWTRVPLGKGSAGMPSFSSIAAIRCDSRVLRRDVSERFGLLSSCKNHGSLA